MLKDKTLLLNTFAVILGLLVTYSIIQIAISFNAKQLGWDQKLFPEWRHVIKFFATESKGTRNNFFISVLLISGFASLIGGIVTAMIVKTAKQAYAMLIGFIMLIISLGDILITPYHPTWYELSIIPVFFFFSWFGGLLVVIFCNKTHK